MIDESRFQRLEDKVDVVKEDIAELKSEFKGGMELMKEHVAGDKKIINELQPVLSKLPDIVEMAEEYRFQQQLKTKVMKTIAAISVVIGLIAGITKIIG